MLDLRPYLSAGSGVWWGQASAEPEPLVNALLDQAVSIGPLRAFTGLTWNPRLGGELPPDLTVYSYGGLGELRHVSRRGLLHVVPCHYSALPRMFARGLLPTDVGLVQVSPPDANRTVSLGIGVDYVADAVRHTRVMIAEINHRMPATASSPRIPLDRFAAVIETDRPLAAARERSPDDVDRAIADHVAGLVRDGDTIQIGVGALPDAVMASLAGHGDLGFHGGMITDGILSLIEKGVLTGARKEIDPGLVITGTALCSPSMYERLGTAPVEFRPTSYTHNPSVLVRLGSLVSINAALEVDLLGQVGAEVSRGAHVGALGGQVDFSRVAATTGAGSIIALRSQAHGRSTITPSLHGGVVTTARADVDYVVTEHGVAALTGGTVAERAQRLVRIAAPQYREGLERHLKNQEQR